MQQRYSDSLPGIISSVTIVNTISLGEKRKYPQIFLLTKHRLGIYFATRRSMREGDLPQ